MKRKSLLTSLFFMLLSALPVFSQKTLTLEECRTLAIENNKNLKIATEQERVAYYQKKEAFSKYLPEISAQGMYMRLEHKFNLLPQTITIPEIGGLIPSMEIPVPENLGEIDMRNTLIGNISITQPLFMGGRIVAYNDIRKNAELLAKSQKDTKLQDVIAETDAAYWQVVSLSWKKGLADSYVNLLKKMESDIDIMMQEGVATKADVLSVSVKLNEAEMAQTKVENGLSLSRMLLNQLCGLNIEGQNTLADENKEVLTSYTSENIIPDVEEAFANRPEIESLELATKIYKGKEKLASAEFLPQVGLMAGYTFTNLNLEHGFQKKFAAMWNIGVMVKYSFSFGHKPNLNAARAETMVTQLQMEEAKEKIELQVNQSAYKLNEANKKLTASEKNMEKADENLRYANVGFEEGVISASDVLAAHTAWLAAHSEVIDAQIDIKLSNIYLKKALGRKL